MIDWLACTLVKALSALFCRLPPSVAVWFGERLGELAYWLQPKRTRVGVLNVRAAFDGQCTSHEARRIIRDSYRQLGAGIIEMLRLPVMDTAYLHRYITVEGEPHLAQAIASGHAVMFLTAHYGNWELSSIVAALRGQPIVALARAQDKLPKLYQLLISYREAKGCTIVHKGGAMKQLITALETGKLVGIVGDQASRQGLFVKFFGRQAQFTAGPFELAFGRDVWVLPVFIHRTRGPFHRLVIEAPIRWDPNLRKSDAARQGLEQFAALLERHIQEQPSQWLWMHKRWKRTPSRRVVVLSDGKTGHVKQSLAVVEAMRERCGDLVSTVIEVRYRSRLSRMLALLWSRVVPRWGAAACLRATLTPESSAVLLRRYADLVVSCGSSMVPVNVLWSSMNHAKSIVVMNPSPLPLRRFDLVIAPRHDALPQQPNVVLTTGAISRMSESALAEAAQRLQMHPRLRPSDPSAGRHPVIGLFIGGDTAEYELTETFAHELATQVLAAAEAVQGDCLVTTSRRTAPVVEQKLSAQFNQHPRCRLLLMASRDALNGTMEGMLGSSDVAIVTGESISMVSEACASGRRVIVVELPLRQISHQTTKHQRFLQGLVQDGYVQLVVVTDIRSAIQRALDEHQPAKRLDDFSAVREAVSRLL